MFFFNERKDKSISKRARGVRQPTPRRKPLSLESLEDRTVPSTVSWINAAGGNWSTAANWFGGVVPNVTQDAIINISVSGPITIDSPVVVHSLMDATASLDLTDGGSLALEAASSVSQNVTISGGGLLTASGSLTVGGALSESGGVLTGSGTVSVNGLLTWTGGVMSGSGTTLADGGLQLGADDGNSYSESLDARTLQNAGAATWASTDSLTQNANSIFQNLAHATLTVQSGVTWSAGGTLDNQGTLTVEAGTGTALLAGFFSNAGNVEVSSGTLFLGAGGNVTGAFTVDAGATLQFGGTQYVFNSGASLSGTGTATFGAPASAAATTFAAGTSFDISGTTNVLAGATIVFDAAASTGILDESGGNLGGPATLTVTGLTTWTNGTMSGSGTTDALGGLSLGASGDTNDNEELAGRTLINAGAGVMNGLDTLTQEESSTFLNQSGASLQIEGGATWSIDILAYDVSGTFDNEGALTVADGSASTLVQAFFINGGSVQVSSGTLQLGYGGAVTGSFTVDSGATLLFGANENYQSFHFSASSTLSAAGTVVFGSGGGADFTSGATYDVTGATVIDSLNSNVVFSPGSIVQSVSALTIEAGVVDFSTGSAITVPSLTMSGGTLTGSDTLEISGLTTWTNGAMAGSGTTVAENGLDLGASDGVTHDENLESRTLINQGMANWVGLGGLALSGGSTFVNQSGATFTEQGDEQISTDSGVGEYPSGTFDNEGKFIVDGGGGISAALTNNGTVEVASGSWVLSGAGASSGTITLDSGASLMLNIYYGIDYTVNEDGTFNSSSQIIGGNESNVTLIQGNQGPTELGGTDVIPLPTTPFTTFFQTGDDTLGSLNMSAGWLNLTGTLTITGSMIWTGGTIAGPGTLIVEGGLQLGTGSDDNQETLLGVTLINEGTITLTDQTVFAQQYGATVENQTNSAIDIQGDCTWTGDDAETIYNQGTIEKTAGLATTEIYDISLVNTGSVAVGSGTLDFEGGGTATGSFTAEAGGTLDFGSSPWAFDAGSSVGGAGTVQFVFDYSSSLFSSGSTYNVSGATQVQSQGPVDFLSGSDVQDLGNLTLVSGTVNFSSGSPVSAASLNESDGVLNGSDTVTISGLTTWTGGVMSGTGTTVADGGLQLGGPGDEESLAVRTLDDASGGTLESMDQFVQSLGSAFLNPASATLNVQDGVSWQSDGDGTATIDNQGILDVAAGSSTVTLSGAVGLVPFLDNTGGITVGSGTLDLACDGTIADSFTIDSGATLQLDGGFTLGTESSIVGPGSVEVSGGDVWVTSGATYSVNGATTIDGGTVEFDGSAGTDTLNESSGDLTGPGTLTVSSLTVWTGGTMDGAGTTIAEGSLQIGQAGDTNDQEILSGRTLSNAGAGTWVGGGAINQNYGGTFVNDANASFTIDNDLTWYSDGTGTFANAGSLVESQSTGTTILQVALDNTGSVQVQQGALSLQGGGVVGGSYLVLAGATLTFGNDNVTTTSLALPIDFTAGPLNWNGTFSGTAHDNSGSGLASVGVSLFNGNDYYDGTAFESATPVFNAAALSGDSWTYTIPTGIFTTDLSNAAASQATDNDGGDEPSSIASFLLAPVAATVTAITPSSGPLAGDTQVTITGTGLANATAVDFGTTPATIVSDTNTTIVVMSPPATEAGSVNVTVTTVGGTSAASQADKFTYTVPPTSSVATLPAYETSATFTISWSGTDDNPGAVINGYTIFVSVNGGSFAPYLTDTTQTSATYTGQNGNTYGFYSVATDNEGNVQPTPSAAQATTTIDTVAPTVSMTAPVNGSATNNTEPTLSATVSTTGDPSGLASVQFQYSSNGGITWTNAGAAETSAPFSFTFTTALADSTYEARAVATDNAGNSATSSAISFTIDTVAPTVTMTAPTNGSDTNNTEPTLSATVSTTGDISGLASVQFEYSSNGGSTWTDAGAAETSAPFSFTFTTALADGNYQARAIATDNAGNSTTSSAVSFTIDTVAPTVTMTAPVNGSDTNNNEPTLSATASDNPGGSGLASVQFQYSNNGGTSWSNAGAAETSGPFSFTFTTALADGSYEARAIATDNAGNSATSSAVSFTIDTVAPTVSMTAPINGSDTNNNKPTLSAMASATGDPSGLANVQFQYSSNGGSTWTDAGAAGTSGPFSFTFTTALADGNYQARAIATDNAGNSTTSSTVSFTIDTVAPTVSMTAPISGSDTNNNEPTLSASVSTTGNISGLAGVQFQYSSNGGSIWTNAGAAETAAPFSFVFTTALADGSYEGRAVATDNAGNSATSTAVSFLIDTVAPTVTMTSPINGSDSSNTKPTLSATASDNTGGSGLASVQFQYSSNGGTTWTNTGSPETTAPFSFTFTTALASGTYEARAIATDNAGNSATSTAVSFGVSVVQTSTTLSNSPGATVVLGSGGKLTDSATLAKGSKPSGTITFTLYAPNGKTIVDTETATVTGNGTYKTPNGYLPSAAGTYEWVASYSGDGANKAVTSAKAAEKVSIAIPTISTTADGPVVVGSGVMVTDSATLSGGYNPTGTIIFDLFAPNGRAVDTQSVKVAGDGTYPTTTGYLPSTAGTYQWVVSYSGDSNNKAVSSSLGKEPVTVIGSGVTVVGKNLYLVGSNGNDHIQIVAYGSSATRSTGVKVNADLKGVSVIKTYSQSFTSIYVFGFGGNDSVQSASSLTVNTVVTLGNGTDDVQLGGGANSVTVGNGNDYVQVGNGNNVVVTGNGADTILAGNGDNLIAAGLGQHTVVVGNGSNILIDGSVQVTQSGVTLAQVLSDWTEFGSASSNVATIHSLLSVTDNSSNANTLLAGGGLDWFWETFGQDTTNKKATDLLN